MRTFAFESEVFCEMPTFVVSAKECDVLWPLDFECVEI
jgi:hypothetical protein